MPYSFIIFSPYGHDKLNGLWLSALVDAGYHERQFFASDPETIL